MNRGMNMKNLIQTPFTTGRKKIFCYEESLNKDNVVEVVNSALLVHNKNVIEIERLFELYRGMDSIISDRTREGANQEINYKAFVSYYSLIADYAANLFMQNPMVLVNIDGEDKVSKDIQAYGKIHRKINKYARDKTTAFHTAICGVGYRFVEQDKRTIIKDSVLSPKSVFSLYGDDTDDEAIARVYITQVRDEHKVMGEEITQQLGVNGFGTKSKYTVYTDDFIYTFVDGDKEVTVADAMPWGCPIVEYKMNPFYIGSFERVTSLIHLLSVLRSDGVNGVVQSIAGIVFGKNIGLPMDNADDTEEIKKNKEQIREQFREQLKVYRQLFANDTKENPASLEYVATELFNADIDVLYQGILNDIITITRTPNSVVNMGGSGNAGAARTASGTDQALENAKNAEPYWFESAREHSRIELDILHYSKELQSLDDGDFEFAMQRSVMTDPITSTQAYQTLINTGVKPSDAARITDISADPEGWEKRIMEFRIEEEERRLDYAKRESEITSSERAEETSGQETEENDSGESREPSQESKP